MTVGVKGHILAAQKDRTGTRNSHPPSDETLDDLYRLAKTQVEGGQAAPSHRRWNSLLVIEIISCLVLGALALRWYRASSQSTLRSENQVFIQSAHQAAGRISNDQGVIAQAEPTATAVPPTPVPILGPSGIPGLDPRVFVPMVWRGPGGCKSAEEISFELVSGPVLEPQQGTRLETNEPPEATATWTIRNLGECQWDSLGIYSVLRSLLNQPQNPPRW